MPVTDKTLGMLLKCKFPSLAFSADNQKMIATKAVIRTLHFSGLTDHTKEVKVICPNSYSIIF